MPWDGRLWPRPPRLLLLGASGFIGRHVLQMVGKTADVVVVTRNAASLELSGVTVQELDLTVDTALEHCLHQTKPDVVINLAGYGIDPRERDPSAFEAVNTVLPARITRALAGIGSDWPGTRLVHAGSALEYGRLSGALDESRECQPDTGYGISKLAGTIGVQRESQAAGLSAVTARLFTVYGPGERAGRLVPSLLDAARSGQRLSLTEGLHRRDFTFVQDAAESLLRLTAVRSGPGEILNAATGVTTRICDFVRTAAGVLGLHDDQLGFGDLPTRAEEIIGDFQVPVHRLRERLGWVPAIPIEEGLRRTGSGLQQ